MGFGKKYDFILKNINKKAPFYEMPSEFDTKKPPNPAFTFGIARNYYEKVNFKYFYFYKKIIIIAFKHYSN